LHSIGTTTKEKKRLTSIVHQLRRPAQPTGPDLNKKNRGGGVGGGAKKRVGRWHIIGGEEGKKKKPSSGFNF